jgi:hypothetical protein
MFLIIICSLGKGLEMADSNKSVLQVLKEMKKERDELAVLIQALERRLGIQTVDSESDSDEGSDPSDAATVTSMPIGFFHNLSQAAAAEKLLKMNPGQPYTTAQILEAFRNSGMSVNPKNALTVLYTALKRNPRFERVGSKAWGLKEWYPEKKRRVSKEGQEPSDSEEDA